MSPKKRENRISFIAIYSAVLLVLGIINLISCSGFTVYYFIKPADFAEGTIINSIAFVTSLFGFYIMLVLSIIYDRLLRNVSRWITFNVINTPLYILFAINAVYRLVFDPQLNIEGNATPAKIAANLALALIVNLTTVTMAFNYIIRNER